MKVDDLNMQAIGKSTSGQRQSLVIRQAPGSAMSLVEEKKGE